MRFSRSNCNFNGLFFMLVFLTFSLGYSESLDNYSNSEGVTALEVVRDGIWDLAVKVYLYETVLFDPDKYFDFSSEDSVIDVSDGSSSISIGTSNEGIWSVPIGPSGVNDINFIPAQLFDITFVVSEGAIYGVSDILAVVTFENFGTEAIRVDLTYTLFDSSNEIIFVDSDSEVVESSKSFVRDFKNQNSVIGVGNYRLVLETVYGDNVRDSFVANFEVVEESASFFSGWVLYLVGFILFIAILVILLFIYRSYFAKSEEVENFDKVPNQLTQNSLVAPINNVQTSNGVATVAGPNTTGADVAVVRTNANNKISKSSSSSDSLDDFEFDEGENLIEDDF
jgi:hypothetical protein